MHCALEGPLALVACNVNLLLVCTLVRCSLYMYTVYHSEPTHSPSQLHASMLAWRFCALLVSKTESKDCLSSVTTKSAALTLINQHGQPEVLIGSLACREKSHVLLRTARTDSTDSLKLAECLVTKGQGKRSCYSTTKFVKTDERSDNVNMNIN